MVTPAAHHIKEYRDGALGGPLKDVICQACVRGSGSAGGSASTGRRCATVSRARNNISTTMTSAVMGRLLVFAFPTVVGVPDDPLSACVEDRVSSMRLGALTPRRSGIKQGRTM